ncbi:uncharacterized protein LOC113292944 [Papaver somniferum]|nr:uncharacterized protein LOC113292944 [Papaver somniferum]
MDIPQDLDDYIKESIDYTLGLPVSERTLETKLLASEDARKRLQDQYFVLHSLLKEKDELIKRSKSEACMSNQAVKRFVEENQKLALECENLLSQCSKLERECSLYDHDREALMEFGNEADERAKEAEIRVVEVENDLKILSEQLDFYKHQCDVRMVNERKATEELISLRQRVTELERLRLLELQDNKVACNKYSSFKTVNGNSPLQMSDDSDLMNVDSSAFSTNLEAHLLDSLIVSITDKDEAAANAHAFLEANSGVESCQGLLKIWDSLSPATQNVIALASEIRALQTDKEHLTTNLVRAEEEVKALFEENTILDEENKRLLRQCNRERHHQGSGDKHTSSPSTKGKKRRSSPKTCSIIERKIDFEQDLPRHPLSPIQYNSPNSRVYNN